MLHRLWNLIKDEPIISIRTLSKMGNKASLVSSVDHKTDKVHIWKYRIIGFKRLKYT